MTGGAGGGEKKSTPTSVCFCCLVVWSVLVVAQLQAAARPASWSGMGATMRHMHSFRSAIFIHDSGVSPVRLCGAKGGNFCLVCLGWCPTQPRAERTSTKANELAACYYNLLHFFGIMADACVIKNAGCWFAGCGAPTHTAFVSSFCALASVEVPSTARVLAVKRRMS